MHNLDEILSNFNQIFSQIKDEAGLEDARVKFLGKKGLVTECFLIKTSLANN